LESRNDDQKERSLTELELDEASGIEALPRRVQRYGIAKTKALEVAEYMAGLEPTRRWNCPVARTADRVRLCGNYLVFRHYTSIDEVRLHAASLCEKHLLCPLCAIRRGSRALQAYLPRYEAIKAAQSDLRPFLVTLTVKDGPGLLERFEHLHKGQRELWMRRHRKRGSPLDGVKAAVWSYEVKRGKGSGLWHPHLHMVALANTQPDVEFLRAAWLSITGDSYIVDVRPINEVDPVRGFMEVFKYALKFSDMTAEDTFGAWQVLQKRRLVGSAGLFRDVEIPESMIDEPLDGLPFVDLFFEYMKGGYSLPTSPT
jgi:hypothetical protein